MQKPESLMLGVSAGDNTATFRAPSSMVIAHPTSLPEQEVTIKVWLDQDGALVVSVQCLDPAVTVVAETTGRVVTKIPSRK